MTTGSVLDRPKLAGGVSPEAQANFRDYQIRLYRERETQGFGRYCATYQHKRCPGVECICGCHL